MKTAAIMITLCLAVVSLCPAADVTVFAAASTTNAVTDIAALYMAGHGDDKVVTSFASSSTLAKQIDNGAPADIYLSANTKWMDYLAEHKMIEPASRSDLLGNRIVLIAPGRSSMADIDVKPDFPLAAAVMAFPLLVRAVRLSLESVDQGLEAAARTLGAGPRRVFFTVTLPLVIPGIITGLILAFARSLGEFGATITFVSNIQGQTQTLPLALYTLTQMPGGEVGAMRLCVLSVAIAMVALVLSELLARRFAAHMKG